MPANYKHTDFDIDLNRNSFTDDVSLRHDRHSIRQSIMNIVLTRKGEKPFDRDFGVGMHNFLFDSPTPTDLQRLEMDIFEEVAAREPRATIKTVKIDDSQLDANDLKVDITYDINHGIDANPILDSLQIAITKVR